MVEKIGKVSWTDYGFYKALVFYNNKGLKHRKGGPARIDTDGYEEYHINGTVFYPSARLIRT